MASTGWFGRPERAFLAGQEEDRFSEFLCQLLAAPAVLDQFLIQFCGVKLSTQELARTQVSTQEVGGEGRIDLVIRSSKRLQVFLAKITSWRPTEPLVSYAKYMEQWLADHPGGKASLMIVAPQATLESAMAATRTELERKLKSAELTKVTWEQIASLAQTLAPTVADLRLKASLEMFVDLVAYRLGPQLRPFTVREIELLQDPAAGTVIYMVEKVVDRTAQVLKDNCWLPKKLTINVASGPGEQFYKGYSFWIDKKEFWFGVWIESWMACGAPICIQSYAFASAKDPLPGLRKIRIPKGDEYQIIPLPLLPDLDIDQQAQRLSEMIQSILDCNWN
jgi:hypothetical protein